MNFALCRLMLKIWSIIIVLITIRHVKQILECLCVLTVSFFPLFIVVACCFYFYDVNLGRYLLVSSKEIFHLRFSFPMLSLNSMGEHLISFYVSFYCNLKKDCQSAGDSLRLVVYDESGSELASVLENLDSIDHERRWLKREVQFRTSSSKIFQVK